MPKCYSMARKINDYLKMSRKKWENRNLIENRGVTRNMQVFYEMWLLAVRNVAGWLLSMWHDSFHESPSF